MGRRTKAAHNITVVVPRSGTAAAPKPLLKTVKNEVKKSNRIFQEQQSVSANELASLEDASNWNGLLLNARGERGPQWDVTSQMYQVNIGYEEYFNPTLLEENPEPIYEDPIEVEPEVKPESRAMSAAEGIPGPGQPMDITMANPNSSPAHMYRNHPNQDIHMSRSGSISGPTGYPQYGQAMNGMHGYPSGPGSGGPMTTGPIQHSPTHAHHPSQMMPPDMGGGMPPHQMYPQRQSSMDMMRPPQQQMPPHPGAPGPGGMPYNNPGGHPGYGGPQQAGYGPGVPGGMPGGVQYPRGPPPPNPGPMGGTYGGMY